MAFLSLFTGGIFSFLLFIAIAVSIFLIFRDVTLWYFKINENTENIRRIADSLERMSLSSQFQTNDENTDDDIIVEDNMEDVEEETRNSSFTEHALSNNKVNRSYK